MLVVVAVQAIFSALAGYAVGVGVSMLAARGAEEWVPQFITNITVRDLALVGIAALLMGLIAAVRPAAQRSRRWTPRWCSGHDGECPCCSSTTWAACSAAERRRSTP